jgi:hypothetical protein
MGKPAKFLVLVLRVINEGHNIKKHHYKLCGCQIFVTLSNTHSVQSQGLTDVNKKERKFNTKQSLPKAIGTRLLV